MSIAGKTRISMLLFSTGILTACVHVDTVNYEGLWAITDKGDNNPAQYHQGPRFKRLEVGEHTLHLGTGARVYFDLKDAQQVSLGQNYDAVSGKGGKGKLVLTTREIDFEPGDYQGAWTISRVRPPSADGMRVDELNGPDKVALVATNATNPDNTIGGQYRLSIGDESSAVWLSVPGNGPAQTAGYDGVDPAHALTITNGRVAFNNVQVRIRETTFTDTPWRIRRVMDDFLSGEARMNLVPGVRYLLETSQGTESFTLNSDCSTSPHPIMVAGLAFEADCPSRVFLDHHVYIAAGVVAVFTPDGKRIATIDAPGLNQAGDVVFSPDGTRLFVSDRRDGEVYIFDAFGGVEQVINLPEGDSYAWGLAVDEASRLYVAGSRQVHVFHDLLYERTLPGTYPLESAIGVDVSADGTRLYVAVSDNTAAGVHHWALDQGGSYEGVLGNTGDNIFGAADVVAEADGDLLITYSGVVPGEGYVYRYSADGQLKERLLNNLHSPLGATDTPDGDFYLVEANRQVNGRNKVLQFAQDGEPMGGMAPYPELSQPVGITVYCCTTSGPNNTNLFLPDAPPTNLAQRKNNAAWVSNLRVAKLNANHFFDHAFEPSSGLETRFNLFDDFTLNVRSLQYQTVGTGTLIWRGVDDSGDPVRIALAIKDRTIDGEIHTLGGTVRIIPLRDGWHQIERHEAGGFPPEAEPVEMSAVAADSDELLRICDVPPAPGDPIPGPGKGPRVHLMIAYTPAAAAALGDINVYSDLLLEQLQSIWTSSSNFHVFPVLAHVHLLSQNANGNPQIDLQSLRNGSDGQWDEVHTLRNQHKADLVAVITQNMSTACGIGYRPSSPSSSNASLGFTVTRSACALTNLSFAHELGHNLSMHHDRSVVSHQPPGTYTYGFSNRNLRIRTIMAYGNYCSSLGFTCRRMPLYSNPELYAKSERMGVPIGEPDAAHNRNMLCVAAGPVSGYRK
ncbi:MAG: M12 family metallo-peptidase [bacterium]